MPSSALDHSATPHSVMRLVTTVMTRTLPVNRPVAHRLRTLYLRT